MVAPIGIVAFVMPFAHEIISGVTSKNSEPVAFPIRPKAVTTSSKINKMSYFVQSSLNLFRYPLGGGSAPVDPAIGSTITAAIVDASCN